MPRSVSLDGLIEVTFQGAEWGNWLPPEPLELLRQRATLTASVATLHAPETRWAVCRKRGRQGAIGACVRPLEAVWGLFWTEIW